VFLSRPLQSITLKDLIKAEIDKLEEENLDELYELVKRFAETKSQNKSGILSKLKQIKIQAPKDFAANVDLNLIREINS
jgi:hypothetical protein